MKSELIHISMGGPEYIIVVGTRSYYFEDHPYCGPTVINRKTKNPRTIQPTHFLKAVSRWAQQGRRVKNHEAIYD